MKNKKLLGVLVALILCLFISKASYASLVWQPSGSGDTDVITIDLTFNVGKGELYICAPGEASPERLLILEDDFFSSNTVTIYKDGDVWKVTSEENTNVITLGGDNEFIFCFSNGTTMYEDYGYILNTSANLYILTNKDTNMTVGVSTAVSPVPIPNVLWLFGSGMLGLIAVRRKFKT